MVVKQSDLQAFKKCSDNALCVKSSPVDAAVAIIKFINQGMHHDGNVKRLFLDDFLTMIGKLENACKGLFINPSNYRVYMDSKEKKDAGDFDAISLYDCLLDALNEAWLVGREFNLSLWVSSHSSNVESLPFAKSRDARAVGDLIFLAKNNQREFIEQALNNPNLIGNNTKRQQLKSVFDGFAASSNEPWVLAKYNNWSLGIVSSEVREEYEKYRHQWDNEVHEPASVHLTNGALSDRMLNTLYKIPVHISDMERLERSFSLPSVQEIKVLPAHPLVSKIIEIINASSSGSIRFDALRKSRKWGTENPKSEDIKEALKLLVEAEKISGSDDEGYTLIK